MSLTNDIVIQLAKFNDTANNPSNAVWENHTKQTVTINQGDQIMISKAYVDTRSLSSANIVILEDTPLELEMYFYWINDGNPGSDALGLNDNVYNEHDHTGTWFSPNTADNIAQGYWINPNYTVQMTLQSVPNIKFTTDVAGNQYAPLPPTSTNSVQQLVYADGRPYLLTTTDNKVYTQTWKYTLPAGTYSPDGLATLLTTAMAEVKKDTAQALQNPNAVDWFDKNSATSQLDQPFIVDTNCYPPIWAAPYLFYGTGGNYNDLLFTLMDSQPYLQIQANYGLPTAHGSLRSDWWRGSIGSDPTYLGPGGFPPVTTPGPPPIPSLCFKNIISDCPTNPAFLPPQGPPVFGSTIPASSMYIGNLYEILTLGDTDWVTAGDTQNNPAQVRDLFVCQHPGTLIPQTPFSFAYMVPNNYYTIAYLGLPFETQYDTPWVEMGMPASYLVVGFTFLCTAVLPWTIANDLTKLAVGITYTIQTIGNVDWTLYGAPYKYASLNFISDIENLQCGDIGLIYPTPQLTNWNPAYITGATCPPLGPIDSTGHNLNFCMPGIMSPVLPQLGGRWVNINIGMDSMANYTLLGSNNYIIASNMLSGSVITYPGSVFGGVDGVNDCILTVTDFGLIDYTFPCQFPLSGAPAMYYSPTVNTWGYYINVKGDTTLNVWNASCIGIPNQIAEVGEVGWMFTLRQYYVEGFATNTRISAFRLSDYQPGFSAPDHFIGDDWLIATSFTITGSLKVFNVPLTFTCSKIVTPVPTGKTFAGYIDGTGTVTNYGAQGTVREVFNPNSPNYYLYPLKLTSNPQSVYNYVGKIGNNDYNYTTGVSMYDYTFPIVGSTEIELAFNDQSNRFQWNYTHSPILQAVAPTASTVDAAVSFSEVVGIVNSFIPDLNAFHNNSPSVGYTSSTCKLVSKSGVMFRSMNPPSFWQGILGFSPALLVTDAELGLTTDGTLNPIDYTTDVGRSRFTYERFNSVTTRGLLTTAMNFTTDSTFPNIEESYITGMFYQPAGTGVPTADATAPVQLAYSSVIDKWYDYEMAYNCITNLSNYFQVWTLPANKDVSNNILYSTPPQWNQSWYQALNSTVIIPAVSGPTLVADEFGHYLLEVQGYEGGGMLNETKKYNTKSIISSYYVNPGSFCTQPFPDPQIYTHVGEPMTLNNFKIRILNPNTMEEVGGLSENSCVYIQINKAYSTIEQTQVDSS